MSRSSLRKINVRKALPENHECLKLGVTPPAENVSINYESYDSIELSVQICAQTIQQNILNEVRSVISGDLGVDDLDLESMLDNFNQDQLNLSLLWSACFKRNDILETLLNLGVDPNFHDANGYTALNLCAFNGDVRGVELLVERGAKADGGDGDYSPLHYASLGEQCMQFL
jgi:ankyrin repeat protein